MLEFKFIPGSTPDQPRVLGGVFLTMLNHIPNMRLIGSMQLEVTMIGKGVRAREIMTNTVSCGWLGAVRLVRLGSLRIVPLINCLERPFLDFGNP